MERLDIGGQADIEGEATALVERGDEAELSEAVRRVMTDCLGYPNFVFGCGIVSYSTPSEHVLLLKHLIAQYTES